MTIETYVMRVNDVRGLLSTLSKKRLDADKNWEEHRDCQGGEDHC